MKKLIRAAAAFAVFFGLTAGGMFLLLPEWFYKSVYSGSRIKGNAEISVDGEKAVFSESSPECMHGGELVNDLKTSGSSLRLKADEEGLYAFTATIDGTELRFYIDKPTADDCVSFDMNFDIDTANRVIHYNGSYKYFSDGVLKAKDVPISGDYSLDYEHHSIGVYINRIDM